MDRGYERENQRRSLAMLLPGSPAMDRETAMVLPAELQKVERRLRVLRDGLRAPLDGGSNSGVTRFVVAR